jgi:hypothetical protein
VFVYTCIFWWLTRTRKVLENVDLKYDIQIVDIRETMRFFGRSKSHALRPRRSHDFFII